MNKKTFDKQQFAHLLLQIYGEFLRYYYYDAIYDIVRIRNLEDESDQLSFHLFFRRQGSDFLFDVAPNWPNLYPVYEKRNNLILQVIYTPKPGDHNSDTYEVEVIKDEYEFLYNNLLWKLVN